MSEMTPMQRALIDGATDFMGRMISDMPRPEGQEGWVYRDIPWCPIHMWNAIMSVAGDGQVAFVGGSRCPDRGVRGQVFVSPAAAERMKEYARDHH